MRFRDVVYSKTAREDLGELEAWIVDRGAPLTARAFVRKQREQIVRFCSMGEVGISREDIGPGVRVAAIGRVVVLFRVGRQRSTIVRVFYGGQDWERRLKR